jgi:NAD(P)H-hydrate epimerase
MSPRRRLLTGAELRELDRAAISAGLPGVVLMEHAGRAVATVARAHPGRILVLAGAGNNGGDGFVAARWLRHWGREVELVLVSGAPREGSDAATHLAAARAAGVPVRSGTSLGPADVIIDAILGTGARPIDADSPLGALVRAINASAARIIAVDLPSGLDADGGPVQGEVVRAHHTVTFAASKLGLASAPGPSFAGRVGIVDIGLEVPAAAGRAELLGDAMLAPRLPPRPSAGHKGTFGHVLCLAGSPGKSGAGLLAALAAIRSGAGLVSLAVPAALSRELEGRVPEVMLRELELGAELAAATQALREALAGKQALVWGPGIPPTRHVGELVRSLAVPAVLDADALNALAASPGATSGLGEARQLVLTPHPGEAARLLGLDGARAIQADRVGAARQLAAETQAIVVLKGERTLIADPAGELAVCATGNPGMGTGGTGDVLAGVIGALLAQGASPWDAATIGAHVHGRAGDLAAARLGLRGLRARDLVARLPRAFLSLCP